MARHFRETIDADGVCLITLDRPERLNALTFDVYRELADRFASLAGDSRAHAVVITGAGRAFCSGGDVHDIIGRLVDMPHDQVLAFTRLTGELIGNMHRLEKPIVAAVNGIAAGAGAVIVAASDLRVFADSARIAFLFTKVGLTGADMGAGWLLPRLVGQGRAAELLLLGDTIDAHTAERYGLATRVVQLSECLPEAMALGKRLAQGPLAALASTKRLLRAEWLMDLDHALEAEAQAQAGHLIQPDHREYHESFVGKRPAQFSGARAAQTRQQGAGASAGGADAAHASHRTTEDPRA
jgi:enoyl-CoA hydratase/carnithine racemase